MRYIMSLFFLMSLFSTSIPVSAFDQSIVFEARQQVEQSKQNLDSGISTILDVLRAEAFLKILEFKNEKDPTKKKTLCQNLLNSVVKMKAGQSRGPNNEVRVSFEAQYALLQLADAQDQCEALK